MYEAVQGCIEGVIFQNHGWHSTKPCRCWFTTALLILECIIAMVSEMAGPAPINQ